MIDWSIYPKNKILFAEDSTFLVKVSDTIIEPKCEKTLRMSHIDVSFYYNGSDFIGYLIKVPENPKFLKVAPYLIFCSETKRPGKSFELVHIDGFSLVRIFDNKDVLFVLL